MARVLTSREAVMLAAGRGSRLEALTAKRPKCLIEVGGSSIALRLLGQLARIEFDRAIVVCGYRADMVCDALREAPIEAEFVVNRNFMETGTAHSLALGLSRSRPAADLLVVEGDMVFADSVLESAISTPHAIATVVDSKSSDSGSRLAVAATGRVMAWVHPDDAGARGATHCKALNLTAVNSPRAREELKGLADAEASIAPTASAERAFDRLCRARPVYAVEVGDQPWAEIDDGADLAAACHLFGSREVS
jgi:bifunctional N-acetylglucosamine-1-phosphate-uridyltransferase/glucosamine-1-phosphate-acetyltransferase GlmU-like protein